MPSTPAALEPLEQRLLLSAWIEGAVWHDLNGDGFRDLDEPGLDGWTVELLDGDTGEVEATAVTVGSDVNGDETIDPITETGLYAFEVVEEVSYDVRQVEQDGWRQTYPIASTYTLTLLDGETESDISFGDTRIGSVSGQVFADVDGDGVRDAGEVGLDGWTVELLDGAGGEVLDTATTAPRDVDGDGGADPETETGLYAFADLPPGDYTVRQTLPAGWVQTYPTSPDHAITLGYGQEVDDADFARHALPGEIHGGVWDDADGNGQWDTDETGLVDWRVFIDEDDDGLWDPGESFEMTGPDGSYAFTDLAPGTYVVAEDVQDGWDQTSPGGGAVQFASAAAVTVAIEPITTSGSVSAAHLTGELVAADTSGSPVVQVAVSGPLINVDDFRADTRFAGIDGSGLAAVIIDTGIDLDHPFFGPDTDSDGVADRIVYSYDFADDDPDATDLNGHGSNVSSIVASSDATYTGMAPGADIIHLKVFSDSGTSYFSYVEDALQWVVANAAAYNIASVNMSIGDESNYVSATSRYGLGDELSALAAMDVIVVSASGNEFYSSDSEPGVTYPAADPNSLAIGAVYDSGPSGYAYGSGARAYSSGADRIAPFSQRHETLMTVFAPGAPITGAGPTGGTRTLHGTSQASPHVAGIAVLTQQLALDRLGRRLSPDEFASLLRSTGVTINDGDDEDDNVTNTGLDYPRVDVLALGEAIVAMADNAPVHVVHLDPEQIETGVDFGNRREVVLSAETEVPDLVAGRDTGVSDSDDVTALNNGTAGAKLQFSVGGTVADATVTIYADGAPVGSAMATGTTTLVETDGVNTLGEGDREITARQTEVGKGASGDSVALIVTIDTVAPTVDGFGLDSSDAEWRVGTVDSAEWTAGRDYETAPWSTVDVLAVSFDEAVAAATGDLTLTGIDAGAVAVTDVAGEETTDVAFTVAGTAGGYLDRDRYDVSLGTNVTDIAGNPLAGWSTELALLPGDINGDGEVGSLDRRDLRNAYGSEIGYAGYSVLVDVNGDGSAGSLDRRVLRNHYAQSLPELPEAPPAQADATAGGAVLTAGAGAAMRTFTTAAGETVAAGWSAARASAEAGGATIEVSVGAEQRAKPQAVRGAAIVSSVEGQVEAGTEDGTGASVSEEDGFARAGALGPAIEPVGVFFWSDGAWAGADDWVVVDDGGAAGEAQLEPDLSAGLTDPLTGDAIQASR